MTYKIKKGKGIIMKIENINIIDISKNVNKDKDIIYDKNLNDIAPFIILSTFIEDVKNFKTKSFDISSKSFICDIKEASKLATTIYEKFLADNYYYIKYSNNSVNNDDTLFYTKNEKILEYINKSNTLENIVNYNKENRDINSYVHINIILNTLKYFKDILLVKIAKENIPTIYNSNNIVFKIDLGI